MSDVSDVLGCLLYVRYTFIQDASGVSDVSDVLDVSDMVGHTGHSFAHVQRRSEDGVTSEDGAEQANMGVLTCVLWAFARTSAWC